MKLAFLSATLIVASGVMSAADPNMTKEERDKALAAFRESRDQFLRSIADVNDAQMPLERWASMRSTSWRTSSGASASSPSPPSQAA